MCSFSKCCFMCYELGVLIGRHGAGMALEHSVTVV
jgi:hypothetical protein